MQNEVFPITYTPFTGILSNTASYYGSQLSDSKLSYARSIIAGEKDPTSEEKTDSPDKTLTYTGPPYVGPNGTTSKDTTAPIVISSGNHSLFDNWTDDDSQCTQDLLRDAQHVIRVTNQLTPDPIQRISLRHRRFWSKRGWRQRVRDWREKAPSGMWYPCEMREGPDEDPRMPMCNVCHMRIRQHGQVCLTNIVRVPE